MDFTVESYDVVPIMNSTWPPSSSELDIMAERQEDIKRLNDISQCIRNSYIWVVFALGFPGNFFSIVTVLTMQTMTPATFFIAFLALCDGCTLAVKLVGHQLHAHQVYIGDVGCKLQFLPIFLSILSNKVLVLICAERFVSVCFPLTRYLIFTKKRSYICSAALTIIILVPIGILYGVMRGADPSGLLCGTHDAYLSFWRNGWYWINALFNLFIPFISIVILTALIIRGLYQSRLQRRSMLGEAGEKHDNTVRLVAESERMERAITFMLILAAIVFLVLTLPSCIYIMAAPIHTDQLTAARWGVFDQVQFVLIDSSHAVNFFLYFLSLKRFRSQFFYILTCKLRSRRSRFDRRNESSVSTKYTLTKSDEDVSHL